MGLPLALLISFVALTVITANGNESSVQTVSNKGDRYCEILELAFVELTEAEQESFSRLSISESPVEFHGDRFHLIHERLKGSCKDRFFVGKLLVEIQRKAFTEESRKYLSEKESEAISIITSLWKQDSIRNSDLAHERDLILSFHGFSEQSRGELIDVAFEVEGLSHSVLFILWSNTFKEDVRISNQLFEKFETTLDSNEKVLLGFLLVKTGIKRQEMLRMDEVFADPTFSPEKTSGLRNILSRLINNENVAFREIDLLGLLADD